MKSHLPAFTVVLMVLAAVGAVEALAAAGDVGVAAQSNDVLETMVFELTFEIGAVADEGTVDTPLLAGLYGRLGRCYLALERFDEAMGAYSQALGLAAQTGHFDKRRQAVLLRGLVACQLEMKMDKPACKTLARVIVLERQLQVTPVARAQSYEALARLQHRLGDEKAAYRNYGRALRLRKAQLGSTDVSLIVPLVAMGDLLVGVGCTERARKAYGRALLISKAACGGLANPLARTPLLKLARLLKRSGEHQLAKRMLARARMCPIGAGQESGPIGGLGISVD